MSQSSTAPPLRVNTTTSQDGLPVHKVTLPNSPQLSIDRKGITEMTKIFEAQGNTEEALRVAEEVEERLPHVADALRELVANGTTTIHLDGSVTTSS
jgi:hypothetical protein